MIDVPCAVRAKAMVTGAGAWLAALPELVRELEQDWRFTVGQPCAGGTEAFVSEVDLADGTPAILKLIVPRSDDAAANEITVLRLTHGEGCVRLLCDDESRGALLLERLGCPLEALGLPLRKRQEVLYSTAARVWRHAPGCDLPTGADKGRWLMDFIESRWEALDHPCSERAVEHAVACAARRIAAHDDERAVVVHGDVHQWNALQSQDGFKLIDPDGLLAEAEYDLGILMREDPLDALHGDVRERAWWLAELSGLDATAIWEWGVVERVSTGLLCTEIDLQSVGRQMLAVADRVTAL